MAVFFITVIHAVIFLNSHSMTTHFLKISDLDKHQLQEVLTLSKVIDQQPQLYKDSLKNKIALFCFEKPSFRTLVGSEAALIQCGGSAIHTSPDAFLGGNIVHAGQDLGQREPIKDTIRIASDYCDLLFLRVFSHQTLVDVQKYSTIPVVNALCDLDHPCQALADLYTIQDHFGENKKLTILFAGDATNVAYSLAEISIIFGHHFIWSGPSSFGFTSEQIETLKNLSKKYGGSLLFDPDINNAIKLADVVVADSFVSMGCEDEYDVRIKELMPYQINESLWEKANPEAIFLHCLPAHRGYEVTESIIDGPQSKILSEAHNRMKTARGLFNFLIN
jgi:ornithine carbamoyltransferase